MNTPGRRTTVRCPIPPEYNWQSLTALRGAELEGHYTVVLRELGKNKGILGQIFTKSQNKIQEPGQAV
jgi:type I restriction enzyme M protein